MTAQLEAPGLTADWLNGWLAAIGVTVLLPDVKLAWSDEGVPYAVFEHDRGAGDLPERLSASMPDEGSLESSILADLPRRVTLEEFRSRSADERRQRSLHLAASVSDLRFDADQGNLDHGAFDPPGPGTVGALWHRAVKCAAKIPSDERVEWITRSLAGEGTRVTVNGLGFDSRRLASGVRGNEASGANQADPVVELLCFSSLALFPTRGDGRQIRQRGWRRSSTQDGSFTWVAWRPWLDRWAIDAFLDLDVGHRSYAGKDVIARYEVVPYRRKADADPTRAYFARRVR
jgi:hypothetical protein